MMNEFKIKCTLTDNSTGKTVAIEKLTEKERLKAAEKITVRVLQILYGPEYEIKFEKP